MQQLKKGINTIKEQQALVNDMVAMREHCVLLELFAGCARWPSTAMTRHGWEMMAPVDIIYMART